MVSTVTDKGQITLPKAVRDRLGIRAGTRVEFDIQPDNTLRIRVLTTGAAGLFGLLARPGEAARSLDEIDAGIATAVKARTGSPRGVRRP